MEVRRQTDHRGRCSKRQPGGILGAKVALLELGIAVMTDEEACHLVEEKLDSRDRVAREWAEYQGKPVPSWVGQDR